MTTQALLTRILGRPDVNGHYPIPIPIVELDLDPGVDPRGSTADSSSGALDAKGAVLALTVPSLQYWLVSQVAVRLTAGASGTQARGSFFYRLTGAATYARHTIIHGPWLDLTAAANDVFGHRLDRQLWIPPGSSLGFVCDGPSTGFGVGATGIFYTHFLPFRITG